MKESQVAYKVFVINYLINLNFFHNSLLCRSRHWVYLFYSNVCVSRRNEKIIYSQGTLIVWNCEKNSFDFDLNEERWARMEIVLELCEFSRVRRLTLELQTK